ncbi:hypothetical protein OG216_03815 [Streptomycetaceae bacterium NBC_01309]
MPGQNEPQSLADRMAQALAREISHLAAAAVSHRMSGGRDKSRLYGGAALAAHDVLASIQREFTRHVNAAQAGAVGPRPDTNFMRFMPDPYAAPSSPLDRQLAQGVDGLISQVRDELPHALATSVLDSSIEAVARSSSPMGAAVLQDVVHMYVEAARLVADSSEATRAHGWAMESAAEALLGQRIVETTAEFFAATSEEVPVQMIETDPGLAQRVNSPEAQRARLDARIEQVEHVYLQRQRAAALSGERPVPTVANQGTGERTADGAPRPGRLPAGQSELNGPAERTTAEGPSPVTHIAAAGMSPMDKKFSAASREANRQVNNARVNTAGVHIPTRLEAGERLPEPRVSLSKGRILRPNAAS